MAVNYRWILEDHELPVLEILHAGRWTVAEMGEAVTKAMAEHPDDDFKFLAVCVFPDNQYFPPDALSKLPGMVRSTPMRRCQGMINVRHPLKDDFDLRPEMVTRMMEVLGFPLLFSPDRDSANADIGTLASKINVSPAASPIFRASPVTVTSPADTVDKKSKADKANTRE